MDWQPSSAAQKEHKNWFAEGSLGSRGDSKISACGGGVVLHAFSECDAILPYLKSLYSQYKDFFGRLSWPGLHSSSAIEGALYHVPYSIKGPT